jgi:DNA-binding HxlR family transcriptional regulator
MSSRGEPTGPKVSCCPLYHEAVELIGRRWTGAIVAVLLDGGMLRFSEIANAVPELSDRLLSERMKELEARGVVRRTVESGPPVRVHYELTAMGRSLQPALTELRDWARQWLDAADAPERVRAPARRPAHERGPARERAPAR